MPTEKIQALILAAGKSSRFNTAASKLTFTLCGQEMIAYPVQTLCQLAIPVTVILGYQKEQIRSILEKYTFNNVHYSEQIEQRGTGHAVLSTQKAWHADNILVLNGDMPLINKEIIQELIDTHEQSHATITFVTAHNPDTALGGYGRVIKENGTVAIVEARDFTQDPAEHCCINAGIYLIKRSFLEQELPNLEINRASGELYITDLIKRASDKKQKIETVNAPFDLVRGVNTLKELWVAEQIKKAEIIHYWMDKGVRFMAAQNVAIDQQVALESDTVIGAGVQLRGTTRIASGCTIDAFSIITNSLIGARSTVLSHSVITNSILEEQVQVGPFAHIHRSSTLKDNSVIGNFVEVSKSIVGAKTKAKHLAYVGQSVIGESVTVGAGTVTCNYNSVSKNTTHVEDNVFIGSNTTLIAPVTLGKDCFIAAGSTITHSVPSEALAIARSRQENKPDYAVKLKERYKKQENS
ncbi:bifunctional UDP-N-acetylglucosamine diphosphorylase/glucosamine-1-phosphate N-acetyltransferase GlmU [Candidatus Dependentiae bacterium]|nr:bifunctional UDP-N-acetylglucosamine diphosphorylase/glucosamine-1-phosphate N-acetyltransferase GlmU [Candidatus Dependentiae bacterium]